MGGCCSSSLSNRRRVNGVIWNDSDYYVEYCVFGPVEHVESMLMSSQFNPNLETGLGFKVNAYNS